jgi:hypothetical protein
MECNNTATKLPREESKVPLPNVLFNHNFTLECGHYLTHSSTNHIFILKYKPDVGIVAYKCIFDVDKQVPKLIIEDFFYLNAKNENMFVRWALGYCL